MGQVSGDFPARARTRGPTFAMFDAEPEETPWEEAALEFVHACIPRLVVHTRRDGTLAYRRECGKCGEPAGTWISHMHLSTEGKAAAVPFDDLLRGKWQAKIDNRAREILAERRAEMSRASKATHAEYLRSVVWRDKRRRVLERCGGLCEGCRRATVAVVHHLTYDRWPGRELLYDLVGLCRDCHDIAHGYDLKPETKGDDGDADG